MSRHKPHLDPATGSPLHPLPPSSAATEQTLPCPFCGSETLIGDTGTCWVRCASVDCGAEGPLRDNETDAITAWNAGITNVAQPTRMASGDWAQLLTLRDVMKTAYKRGGDRLMSVWERDLNAIEAAIMILDKAARPPAAPVDQERLAELQNEAGMYKSLYENAIAQRSSADSVRAFAEDYASHKEGCEEETWHGKGPARCSCGYYEALDRITAQPQEARSREDIAKIIGGDIFHGSDDGVGPATRHARVEALKKADAILALSRPKCGGFDGTA
jgi:hypothetical protein